MNKIITITLIICLLSLLIFLPLTDDYIEELENSIYIKASKRYNIKPSNSIKDKIINNTNNGNNANIPDISDPNFNSNMSEDIKQANQLIYSIASKYAQIGQAKYPNLPKISAINIISISRQEKLPKPNELLMWQGDNAQWKNNPENILYLTSRDIGTGGMAYQGPLQLSSTYGLSCLISESEFNLYPNDRSNIPSSINRTIGALYNEFSNMPNDVIEITKSLNDYGIQALLALAHNNGGSVITSSLNTKKIASSWPVSKLATLQFCQAISSPMIIDKIKSYVDNNNITYINWHSPIDIEVLQIIKDNWNWDNQTENFLNKQLEYMKKGQQYYNGSYSMSHRAAYPINAVIYNVYVRQLLQGR